MEKPKIRRKEYWDYNECIAFCEEKYGFDNYNYQGNNFWHWLIAQYEIHNGCDITIYRDMLEDEDPPEWQRTILGYLFTEFGDLNGEEQYEIEFNVWW